MKRRMKLLSVKLTHLSITDNETAGFGIIFDSTRGEKGKL